MATRAGQGHGPAVGLERLLMFSDAVTAIAITLLALDLTVAGRRPAGTAAQRRRVLRHAARMDPAFPAGRMFGRTHRAVEAGATA